MAGGAGSCALRRLRLRAGRSCLLPQPTGAALSKPPQELEPDSTSLQAVGPGQRLPFPLSAWLLGRLSLVFCLFKPHLSGGGAGVCGRVLKVFTPAWCPSANTSQCPDQVALQQHIQARVTFCLLSPLFLFFWLRLTV